MKTKQVPLALQPTWEILRVGAGSKEVSKQDYFLVDDIGHEFADKGLILLAVDVLEPKKTVKKYLEEHPRSCRIVLTEDTNLAAMYQANSYPIYVVIDRDGNIAGTQRGAAGERGLRYLLRRAGLASE